MGKVADEKEHTLPQGDDTALSVVMSRYALVVRRERGLPMQSPWTALHAHTDRCGAPQDGRTHRLAGPQAATADRR